MTGTDNRWRIWTAGRADADALVRLEALAFGAKSWGEDSVRASFVASRVTIFFGGETKGNPAGFVMWRDLGEEAEILTLGVEGSVRGGGLGACLLRAALDAARSGGAQRFFLEVNATNEAGRRLYESAGFREVGARKRYYADGGDAIVMALSL